MRASGSPESAVELRAHAALIAGLGLGLAVASCGPAASVSSSPSAPGRAGREVSSNVEFADYAGTQACAKCHAGHVKSWLASPMHNMTREPSLADVKGPFDGTTFRFKVDSARLETVGTARFITIQSTRFGAGIYRLTRRRR